jgi:DNA-directed RNA polymerase subunit RPC12/RpoP
MNSATAVIVYILLGTLGVFIFSFISFCRIQKHRHYQCRGCGHRFKPGCAEAFFSRRDNVTDRLLFCPRCGGRGFFENIEDNEATQEEKEEKEDKGR